MFLLYRFLNTSPSLHAQVFIHPYITFLLYTSTAIPSQTIGRSWEPSISLSATFSRSLYADFFAFLSRLKFISFRLFGMCYVPCFARCPAFAIASSHPLLICRFELFLGLHQKGDLFRGFYFLFFSISGLSKIYVFFLCC